jgi:AcrR family transcriptional regulator
VSDVAAVADQTAPRQGSKGQATRERIVEHALRVAGERGLEGLTIGELATDLGLSKSGLFAHFKSKERLQLAVLEAAADDFTRQVFGPALKEPRGLVRLRSILQHWLEWVHSSRLPGGCIFIAGAMEWDDREGPVRDALVHWFAELSAGLQKAVRLCIETGELRADTDPAAIAYELHGIALKFHLEQRLLRSPKAFERTNHAFERLLDSARA